MSKAITTALTLSGLDDTTVYSIADGKVRTGSDNSAGNAVSWKVEYEVKVKEKHRAEILCSVLFSLEPTMQNETALYHKQSVRLAPLCESSYILIEFHEGGVFWI